MMYELSLGFDWYDAELRDEFKDAIDSLGLATELRYEYVGIPAVQMLFAKATAEQTTLMKLKFPRITIRKCID